MPVRRLDQIFPTPKQILAGDGTATFRVSDLDLRLPAEAGGLIQSAVDAITRAVGHELPASSATATLTISVDDSTLSSQCVPEQDEGYVLQISNVGIQIIGRDPAGCYYGAITLSQIMTVDNGFVTCPEVTIIDWPDYHYRGLFIEDFWGADLMGVEDYRDLIERCAVLKLNTLAIGIFGGWEIKHHGKLTEFLMVPLERHPELKTPQLIRYVDPESRQKVELNYLPRMFEEDHLNQIIRLAQEKNIKVIPLWGGPAHVTLLPRLHPEISARDCQGQLTHYGYCMSEPATWELLFDILDEIAEKYLLPNGLDTLQLACDEIYPIRGIYEDDPLIEVNPWCRCAECATHSEAELLTKYVITLAGHLKEKGIKTFIWQDTFERLDAMDVLWEGLRAAGLEDDISMGWWCYKEPLPDFSSRLPIPNWAQPSTGILASIFYQDFSRNIYGMLRRGWEAGAVGATAYNVPDPAQHKNYHCLAEFAWNQAAGSTLPHFNIKYAQTHFGDSWRDALEAYDVAERVFGSYPLIVYTLDQLIYYFNSYPYGVQDYPTNVLSSVASNPLALKEALRQSVAHVTTAKTLIARCREDDRAGLIPLFTHECDRVVSVVEAVLDTVEALSGYTEARGILAANRDRALALLESSTKRVRAPLDEMLRVMREMKNLKPAYLLPATWQELSYLVSFMDDLVAQLRQLRERVAKDRLDQLPLLPIVEQIGERTLRSAWHPWEF